MSGAQSDLAMGARGARADPAVPLSRRAEYALETALAGLDIPALGWAGYDRLVDAVQRALAPLPRVRHFETGAGAVRLAYTDTGGPGEALICIGGLTNTLRRFDFIGHGLGDRSRVIALDLAGRGHSGWLVAQEDYRLDTYVRHLEALVATLDLGRVSLLGSSLGGAIALSYAVRHPDRVGRVVLNDVGPFIPVERRQRRAAALARHYVFRSPADLFRRAGASAKHAGPVGDAVLLHNVHHKTRWSEEEDGRVYRHDLRALLAYREEARQNLDMWAEWDATRCPVLLIHGLESDAVLPQMVDQMRGHPHFSLVEVPETGHTPTLSDPNLIGEIGNWLEADAPFETDRVCIPSSTGRRRLFG